MKFKIYKLLIVLTLLFPAISIRSEVITATSEPFIFGDPPPLPLSPIAFVITTFLIGGGLLWRYYSAKKQAA